MRKKNHGKRILYILGIALIFLAGFIWWQLTTQPIDRYSTTNQAFIIEKGSGLKQIAADLQFNGLIRDKYTFLLAVKILGIESSVQAGTFELSPNMDVFSIARKLTKGVNDIRITIPEGKRAEEVAEIFTAQLSSIDEKELSSALQEHEGYLFPDTYDISKDISIGEIIQLMKNTFDAKYTTISVSSTLPKDDIVIIASMIEREARHAEDRPLVASVIYNRLNIGMKLDIDATVQYAIGYDFTTKEWWKKGLTLDDLAIQSPYNTYINAGLPPAPIANPGLASLTAAANPANSNYFYYITDKEGINRYAKTLNEHQSNINKYGL